MISERSSSSNSSRLMSWAGLEIHKTHSIQLQHLKLSELRGGTLHIQWLWLLHRRFPNNSCTQWVMPVSLMSWCAASSHPGLSFLPAPLDSAGGRLCSVSVCNVWRKCCSAGFCKQRSSPHITYGCSVCSSILPGLSLQCHILISDLTC